MGPLDLAAIGATVFATAVLSGVLGMAGGIALLAVLLLYLPPLVAIPVHGVIQLVSNGSRVVAQRRHARFEWIGWYALPLVPAGLLGLEVAQALPEAVLEGAIGAVVLLATWLPKSRGDGEPAAAQPRVRFLALGGCSGFLNMVLGATGVLIDPFFLGLGLSRQALVGTKAACQTIGHVVKGACSARPASPSPSTRRCSRSEPRAPRSAPGPGAGCSTGSARRASSGSTARCSRVSRCVWCGRRSPSESERIGVESGSDFTFSDLPIYPAGRI